MKGQTEQLEPVPTIETDGWRGYEHFTDPTRLPFNTLAFPSINCLIPSKDKVVPRKGKTLLGQGFSSEEVEIGFDGFSQSEIDAGVIKEFSPYEFSSDADSSTAYNSSIQVDSTHYLNFWTGHEGSGFAQVVEVDLITGVIVDKGTPIQYESDLKGYNSCGQIDSNHFINFWTGPSFHGFVQVFEVDLTTYEITLKSTPLTFFAGGTFYNSCVKVDSNHYLNFWQDGDAVDGKAQSFAINLSTYAVTAVGSPLVFKASNVLFNSCGQVDSSHFINFFSDASGFGEAIVVTVNLSTYAVTIFITPITFDGVSNAFNGCIKVDSTHFLNFWRGTGGEGLAQVFNINIGGTSLTALGSAFQFDAGPDVGYNSPASFNDGINFMNFWTNGNSQYTQVITINASTGAFEALGSPFKFRNNKNGRFNSSVAVGNGINFMNFWVEAGNEGAVALFNVDLIINSSSLAHGCSGDNRILFASILTRNTGGGDQVTAVTYNGVAMTQAGKVALDAQRERYLYFLVNPDVEIFTAEDGIVVTTNNIDRSLIIAASSYFGAKQVAPSIMSTVGPSASVSTISISETPTIDNSWIVALFAGGSDYAGGLTEGANTILRGGNTNYQMADSGDPISPAALHTLTADFDSSTTAVALAIAFAPAGGTPEDKSWPIIGHKKRFTNDGGYIMEVRVVRTADVGMGDQIEVLLENPLTSLMQWYPITEKSNPLEQGDADRYYMDSFFDTNLNPALSFKNSRLVWVNGTKTIFSWSGGVNPITSIIPGVSVTGAIGKSWVSQGFPHITSIFDSTETRYIVINGIKYQVTGGWDTDTLLLSNTGGIEVGDIATAWIAPPLSNIPIQDVIVLPDTYPTIDFCKQNKNYMFYGSFQSRQLFMSNNFNREAIETITTGTSQVVYYNDLALPPTPDFSGSQIVIYTVTIDDDTVGANTFRWEYTTNGITTAGGTNVAITPGITQTLLSPAGDIGIIFGSKSFHNLGDAWKITASPAIGDSQSLGDVNTPPAWANFFYNLPRVPGQGYIFFLPANFFSMEQQEEDLYVCDQFGQWAYINTQIAADLQSETISFTPLKQISASKPIFPYMVSHMENYIVFVTENKTLDFIGRQVFLELPQMSYLSQPVALDFEALSFENGSIEYLNKILYITSPVESTMMMYDNRVENKYWQPLQVINENGILSIVDNTLITHSNFRDQSFNLFTGKSDNGAAFTVRARTCPTAFVKRVGRKYFPARWDSKFSSNSFIEGYIEGNPQLIYTVFLGVNDPNGQSHIVKPVILDNPADTASIGEDILAGHPLGNADPVFQGSYFNEIYRKFKPLLNYYFISLQVACNSKNHSYSILSLGVNMSFSPSGNNTLIGDREVL